jgi:hypothetical protein
MITPGYLERDSLLIMFMTFQHLTNGKMEIKSWVTNLKQLFTKKGYRISWARNHSIRR